MGIKSIIDAGERGKEIALFVTALNQFNNTVGQAYNTLLQEARDKIGNPNIKLADLVGTQINAGLFDGGANDSVIGEVIVTFAAIEDVITTIRSHDSLPAVDN